MIAQVIEEAVRQAFPGVETGLNYESLLEVPPDSKMGDFAFPCFRLSKALRMGPPVIAQKLCAA
ncbi:MAG: arginine--tRNA ligase, partial [Clostridia bacterium]|nr:arginine--tRNA ligase [Clostridia bacterium]